MYERAISDVVIVGAGSAGLSCAYRLASDRPDVCRIPPEYVNKFADNVPARVA